MNSTEALQIQHLELLPTYPVGKPISRHDDRFWASVWEDGTICVAVNVNHNTKKYELGEIIPAILCHRDVHSPNFIVFRLQSPNLRDKFFNVFRAITESSNKIGDGLLFDHIKLQIHEWAAFFSPGRAGMTDGSIRGIWGELFFLKQYLCPILSPQLALDSYAGLHGGAQDFRTEKFSVEIKTTKSANPSQIQISSIDQLEAFNVDQILLLLCLKESSHGISLNQLVNDIEAVLIKDLNAFFEFQKLISSALEQAKDCQLEKCYECTTLTAWQVTEEFPALRRSKLPHAIEEASYKISIRDIDCFKLMCTTEEWLHERTAT